MADMNTAGADRWQPTGGTDANLDEMLNRGPHEGRPIYIHFTSRESYLRISEQQKISRTPDLSEPVVPCFTPDEAHILLFFGNQNYRDSSTHMFVLAFKDQETVEQYPVTQGSPVKEIICLNDVTFGDSGNAVLLHSGGSIFAERNSTPY